MEGNLPHSSGEINSKLLALSFSFGREIRLSQLPGIGTDEEQASPIADPA
jgi:hypothetical protein